MYGKDKRQALAYEVATFRPLKRYAVMFYSGTNFYCILYFLLSQVPLAKIKKKQSQVSLFFLHSKNDYYSVCKIIIITNVFNFIKPVTKRGKHESATFRKLTHYKFIVHI